ncbi:Neutral cholesterol ester hydrolase 1 [Lamellibrachia satsuma]|nr:Neutral cholesterol ester hydrolase 1 [Lamellibrachia satsuma]
MKIAAFILVLTSCGLQATTSTGGRWPKSLLRRSPVERCIEAHIYPCRLPRGRFPWTPSIFHNFTSYVHFFDDFEEAESYRPIESLSKQTETWTMVISCLGLDVHNVHILRNIAPLLFPKPAATPDDPLIKVTLMTFSGVNVILYQPSRRQRAPRRGFVYMFGGAWSLLSAGIADANMRTLVKASNIVVASIDYRKAPEHIYPAGLNDALKATKYFMRNARKFGVDATRIAIGGDSSGANFAAAITLKLRAVNWRPRLKLQVLIYPPLQTIDFMTPSYQEVTCDSGLTQAFMRNFWLGYAFGNITGLPLIDFSRNCHTTAAAKARYGRLVPWSALPNTPHKAAQRRTSLACRRGNAALWNKVKSVFTDQYFAPLMARHLRRLPEAFILNVNQDVLRSDGIIYGRRLKSAEVRVTTAMYNGPHHIFPKSSTATTKKMLRDIAEFLNRRL